MEIVYANKKVEKLCTDLGHSKKKMEERTAKKLLKAINMLETMGCLHEAVAYSPFNFHDLKGNRKGQHAIDIDGRKSKYRLIIEPLNEEGKRYEEYSIDLISKSTKIIIILEVSDHYE